jgi:CheY-like chemotaxis protein
MNAPVSEEPPTATTILVVDDDADIRETYGEVLVEEGYRVVLARDGIEALEYLEHTPSLPDLILLDLMMPRMDGAQFRVQQLHSPRISSIPVVVISASQARGLEATRTMSPAGVLKKPLGLEELLDMVRQTVATS